MDSFFATRSILDVGKGFQHRLLFSSCFAALISDQDVNIGSHGTKIPASTRYYADPIAITVSSMISVFFYQFLNLQNGDSTSQPGAIRALTDLD